MFAINGHGLKLSKKWFTGPTQAQHEHADSELPQYLVFFAAKPTLYGEDGSNARLDLWPLALAVGCGDGIN